MRDMTQRDFGASASMPEQWQRTLFLDGWMRVPRREYTG
jgi:hypothetical protein